MCEIIEAVSVVQIEHLRSLFEEYRAQLPLGFNARSSDAEIAELPGTYAAPRGKLLLATVVGQPVGCVGLRPFPQPGACEMKHLFIRPAFRGSSIGKQLVHRLLKEARLLGYSALRLDSHPPTMPAAVAMYRKLGFREVSAAPLQPLDELIYLELPLVT